MKNCIMSLLDTSSRLPAEQKTERPNGACGLEHGDP